MQRTALAALFIVALMPLRARAADLTLEVEGLDVDHLAGTSLMVGVFTDAGHWLKEAAAGRQFSVAGAVDGRLTVVLKGLPKGRLALSLFHDANGNGQLDMHPMGFPAERYAFSNNALPSAAGAPTFEQAAFTPEAGVPLKIRLR